MKRKGFTLVELVVVVMILGILAAFAVPQYMKSMENSKAEAAVGLLTMVGTTNRMYNIDHGNYLAGELTTSGCATAACNPGSTSACNLVWCKYLAADDWTAKPYRVEASQGACGWTGLGGSDYVACAVRRTSGAGSTTSTPYSTWGYAMKRDGSVICWKGGVVTCGAVDAPPSPERG